MLSRWVDRDAKATVDRYAKAGVAPDLALRVYTTRLLGGDPKLVLHGGGNTSVKLRLSDPLGGETEAMCVKGSGADMATIEPAGMPAVRLAPLQALRARDKLSDDDMARVQRGALLDPLTATPSLEFLLHAFMPHKFVDHTHATAVLSLIDQPEGEKLCGEVYEGSMGYVPYLMPGFGLAKKAGDVFEKNPKVSGLILAKHGVFTFGASAQESYERMIEMVTRAEERLQTNRKTVFKTAPMPQNIAPGAEVAPILRGACALRDADGEGAHRLLILEFRTSDNILRYVNGAELARYARQGVITPDITIRTKNWPLIVPPPEAGKLNEFKQAARAAAEKFMVDYRGYFERNNARAGGGKIMLDPLPRVALVPGLGLYGLGRSAKDALIAADMAEETVACITDAEAIGTFDSISEADMFDCEYWPIEQAKLGKQKELPLAGQIAAITGAAGAIGAATARAFAAAGATLGLFDVNLAAASDLAKDIGTGAVAIHCDVTNDKSVQDAFERLAAWFGGVDIVVSNAGAAWQGKIGEVDDAILRKSFELNFFGHQRVAQAAVKIMLAQGTGGCLLFNVSKQAVNPGPNFGPYGLPKAATLFLVRQYAVDYGADGIRANAVNADRIRSGLLTDDFIKQRSQARGVSEKEYMSGNLLGREVTADDVAQAFLHQALELKTTGDVTTVDGGNIAAALR
ncbi:MAG TPA: bifunctional aldolase/short-chain dehydrogenase [Xanthobacteraceae bacterium]|nr:bifunctional aldolase/short-chain dehydrogenase [Xanthobacteraceae bacterium]